LQPFPINLAIIVHFSFFFPRAYQVATLIGKIPEKM
jgi:hypothetical protein